MDNFERAILFTFDQTGAVDASLKAEAARYCEQVKASPNCWQICLDGFASSTYAEVRFWCLQTLHQLIQEQYTRLDGGQRMTVKQGLMFWGKPDAPRVDLPPFIRNKIAQAIVSILQVEFPSDWPAFFYDVIAMLGHGLNAADMFVRILVALDEDIISLDIPRTQEGVRESMEVKDAMREGSIAEVVKACHQLLLAFHSSQPALAASVLEALRRYVNWVDIGLLATDDFVALLAALVERGSSQQLVCAAADVLSELVSKRMEPLPKLQLIQGLQVAPLAARWTACLLSQQEPDPELLRMCGQLLGTLTTEILEAEKRVENMVVSLMACQVEVDGEASGEAAAASAAAQHLLAETFPSVLMLLRADDDAASVSVVLFLQAYVSKLKAVQKRAEGLSKEQVQQLRAILEAAGDRAMYPESCRDAASDEEGEESVAERRQDLFTLFRNAAKIVPDTAAAVVRDRLQRIASDRQAPFQLVEIGVTLLYQLGEGAPEEALKPGSGSLGALAAVLMQGEVPASGHRLVALALMETYVRYARVLQQDTQYLPNVLAAFLGNRGMAHPDPAVAVRACYLFCRLCKVLRQNLRPHLAEVLLSLQPHLARIASDPLPETAPLPVKAGLGSRNLPGATPTHGADDRLYAYEAAGILLGQEDLPKEEQRDAVAALLRPLLLQIQEQLASAGPKAAPEGRPRAEALLRQAIEAVTRVSKGFSLNLCTRKCPELGELLAAPLQAALVIPQVIPANKALRARIISFLHRMVDCLGDKLIPFLPEAFRALLPTSAEPRDICDTLALLNQLIVRYKAALDPFLVSLLPDILARVHATLGAGWDWSGTAAVPTPLPSHGVGNGVAVSSEEAREQGEVQRAYYSFLHTLTGTSLGGIILRAGGGTVLQPALNDLLRGATSHVDPPTRKICVQTLRRLLSDIANGSQLPGFDTYLVEHVAGGVCFSGLLQSGMDYRDAAVNSLLGELAGLLVEAQTRAPTQLPAYLGNTALPGLGVPQGLRDQLQQGLGAGDAKILKSVLRELLQWASGRTNGARAHHRPKGASPEQTESGENGMMDS